MNSSDKLFIVTQDVEGAEEYILKNFSWDRYRINTMTIETMTEDIRILLMQKGYWYITNLGEDSLWVHSDFMGQDEARDLIDDFIT